MREGPHTDRAGPVEIAERDAESAHIRAGIAPGQLVVTSDHSAFFQNSILIGKVVDTRPVDFGLYTVARVKLAVKMNLLDEVWVMMP